MDRIDSRSRALRSAILLVAAAGAGCAVASEPSSTATSGAALDAACGERFVDAARGSDTRGGGANDCLRRGAPCLTVQRGVDAACPGDTVHVARGTYRENVVIDRAITLEGVGKRTVLVPAVSAPAPCDDSSLCGGAASTIVLVRANDVRVRDLVLDGDNPDLTSGVVVGGADVDARNGLVTDVLAGRWDGLGVDAVTVRNVYLRGLYAASGGTFRFTGNHVTNVRGSAQSVAIFDFGGAGVIEDNDVEEANDAISANDSTGTLFTNNRVRRSGSGVHTDNAGQGPLATADVIDGNEVRDCDAAGYGVWTFVPYLAPSVVGNTVLGCPVGMAALGQGADVRPVFENNRVDGRGLLGAIGARITNDEAGFGTTSIAVTLRGNVIEDTDVGVQVERVTQDPPLSTDVRLECNAIVTNGTGVATASPTVTLHSNAVTDNGIGVDALATTGGTVDARENWWGCAEGPGRPHCDGVVGDVDASDPSAQVPGCVPPAPSKRHGKRSAALVASSFAAPAAPPAARIR